MFDQLLQHADKDNSKSMDVRELLEFCSPDIDNDCTLCERELQIGRKTARVWLACILQHDDAIVDGSRPIWSDSAIDVDELKIYNRCVTAESMYSVPDTYLERADVLLDAAR